MGNGINSSVRGYGSFSVGSISSDLAPWTMSGYKWGSSTLGSGVSISYSFSDAGSSYVGSYANSQNIGVSAFNATQETAAERSMAAYAAVADIRFNEVTESASLAGDIRWANTSSNDVWTAEAYYPSSGASGGDIWFGDQFDYLSPSAGNYAGLTFLHELGHALGLKHPHDSSPFGPSSRDALKYSVMSYRDFVGDADDGYETAFYPTTLMMDDIIAIQTIYGVNNATRNGDTTYRWGSSETIYETIWDGGGTDTIDASNQARGVAINLAAGSFSSIGESFWNGKTEVRNCLGIAFKCKIENAIGSSYHDTLTGNDLSNVLLGGLATDSLSGKSGNDTLNGGSGSDTMVGGSGDDLFRFSKPLSATTNLDKITDFSHADDTIQIDNAIFKKLTATGTLNAVNFKASTAGNATDGNDYILYDTDNGRLFYDFDGNGTGAKVQFALLGTSDHPTLTAADIVVI